VTTRNRPLKNISVCGRCRVRRYLLWVWRAWSYGAIRIGLCRDWL